MWQHLAGMCDSFKLCAAEVYSQNQNNWFANFIISVCEFNQYAGTNKLQIFSHKDPKWEPMSLYENKRTVPENPKIVIEKSCDEFNERTNVQATEASTSAVLQRTRIFWSTRCFQRFLLIFVTVGNAHSESPGPVWCTDSGGAGC